MLRKYLDRADGACYNWVMAEEEEKRYPATVRIVNPDTGKKRCTVEVGGSKMGDEDGKRKPIVEVGKGKLRG